MSQATVMYNNPGRTSRLMALLTIVGIKMIMLIPHFFVLFFLSIVAALVMLIGIVAVIFTGKYPERMANFIFGFYRWSWRLTAYMVCMTDTYPPFTLNETDYPAEIKFEYKPESSRLWAVLTLIPVKMVMLIIHIAILYILEIVAGICMLIGIFASLFMGKYPEGLARVNVTFMQYAMKVGMYLLCLDDKYPSFGWSEEA